MGHMEIVAHRGASAHAPEHTFEAYDLALDLGADALEIDLRMTAAHWLVAQHDPTLERTGGGPVAIATMTKREYRRLPGTLQPLRLQLLLRHYGDRTRFLLELKEPAPPMERCLVTAVARAGVGERVVVQAFSMRSLERVRRLDPALPVAPLVDGPASTEWLDQARELGAAAVGIRTEHVDAAAVTAAHERGLTVRAWTVNEPEEAVRLAELGVDGLITDTPRVVRDAAEASVPALTV